MEGVGDRGEPLFLGDAGELGVEDAPLFLLAIGRREQVRSGGADHAGGVRRRDLERPPSRYLKKTLACSFSFSRFREQRADLLEAFLLRDAREVPVAVTCLALASERLQLTSSRAIDTPAWVMSHPVGGGGKGRSPSCWRAAGELGPSRQRVRILRATEAHGRRDLVVACEYVVEAISRRLPGTPAPTSIRSPATTSVSFAPNPECSSARSSSEVLPAKVGHDDGAGHVRLLARAREWMRSRQSVAQTVTVACVRSPARREGSRSPRWPS